MKSERRLQATYAQYTSPGIKKSVIPLEHDETKQRTVANQISAVLKNLPDHC